MCCSPLKTFPGDWSEPSQSQSLKYLQKITFYHCFDSIWMPPHRSFHFHESVVCRYESCPLRLGRKSSFSNSTDPVTIINLFPSSERANENHTCWFSLVNWANVFDGCNVVTNAHEKENASGGVSC